MTVGKNDPMDDRRRFERVNMPDAAKVYITDEQNARIGSVKVLGRGGMLVKTEKPLSTGSHRALYLVDDSEGIRRELHAVVRYNSDEGTGLEFENLEPDAAVEVGVIIGKYYAAGAHQ
jgi:hypothetical protein